MQTFQLCACGAAPGYPHRADCPRPLFNPTDRQFEQWEKEWLFKQDMNRAIRQAISKLDKGTVGIGEDCLWQLTVTQLSRAHAPAGANCAWVARQTFNDIVRDNPFTRFVYRQ